MKHNFPQNFLQIAKYNENHFSDHFQEEARATKCRNVITHEFSASTTL